MSNLSNHNNTSQSTSQNTSQNPAQNTAQNLSPNTSSHTHQFSSSRSFRLWLIWELQQLRKSMLIWWSVAAALMMMVIAMQPALVAKAELLKQAMSGLPSGMLKVMQLDTADLGNPVEFIAVYFIYASIIGALASANWGAGALARDETQHTAELFYALPVSRDVLLLAKLSAASIAVLVWNLALALWVALSCTLFLSSSTVSSSTVSSGAVSSGVQIDMGALLLLFAGNAIIDLAVAGAGWVLAAFSKNMRTATSAALGGAMGLYVLQMISSISDKAEWLKWLTPLSYMTSMDVVRSGALDGQKMLVLVLMGVGLWATGWLSYRRRDIHA